MEKHTSYSSNNEEMRAELMILRDVNNRLTEQIKSLECQTTRYNIKKEENIVLIKESNENENKFKQEKTFLEKCLLDSRKMCTVHACNVEKLCREKKMLMMENNRARLELLQLKLEYADLDAKKYDSIVVDMKQMATENETNTIRYREKVDDLCMTIKKLEEEKTQLNSRISNIISENKFDEDKLKNLYSKINVLTIENKKLEERRKDSDKEICDLDNQNNNYFCENQNLKKENSKLILKLAEAISGKPLSISINI